MMPNRWFRRVCRHLPPALAYRLYYPRVDQLLGSAERFENARAMYGQARLSSSMVDVVDLMFAFHGCSEWLGLTLCRLLTRPGSTIFEIGANLGTDTLNLAAIVGPSGRLVSVEPGETCFARLKERVELNHLSQVTVLRQAVAEAPGKFALQLGPDTNSGMAYLQGASAESQDFVEATTIDALAESFGAPQFIWMDIEGFELHALRGGAQVLRASRPFIYTEVDRGLLERAGDSLDAFEQFVEDRGYQAVDPSSWRLPLLERGTVPPGYHHENRLLVPKERLLEVAAIRLRFLAARLLPRL